MQLSNGRVSFTFDDKIGSLVQIENPATGRKFISSPAYARLFRLILPTGDWISHHADNEDTPPMLVRDGNELQIRYDDLLADGKPTGVSAVVRVSLAPGSEEAIFTLELRNNGEYTIEQVRFPWIAGWTGIAGPGHDVLTSACEHRDPYRMFPKALNVNCLHRNPYRLYDTFPAHLFLPWMDISGGGEGLSYICYLEKSTVSGLAYEHLRPYDHDGLCLGWSWVNDPDIKPGESWTSPRIGIGVHTSDWHATSDRYREWLERWYKPADAPERLKRSIGILNLMFRSWDGTEFHQFSDLPHLAKDALSVGVEDICVWDNTADLYARDDRSEILEDTPQRSEELRSALAQTKRLGCNVSMLLNFRLMRANSEPFAKYGEKLAIRQRNGEPLMDNRYAASHFHASTGHGPKYRNGTTYILCQTPEDFSQRALGLVRNGLDLGLTSMFLDQANEWEYCFSKEHGHSRPDDTPQGAHRWAEQAAIMVKSKNPEGYLIGEEGDVFSTQNIHIWWHWFWNYKNGEVFRYCLPESLQTWVVDSDLAEMNRAFVLGFYMAILCHGMEKSLKDVPEAAQHIRRLAALRKKCAESTVNARFLDNKGMDCSNNVLAKVYLSDQTLAVIVGEVAGQPGEYELRIDADALGARLSTDNVRMHSSGGTNRSVEVIASDELVLVKDRVLPLEVQVIEVSIVRTDVATAPEKSVLKRKEVVV